MRETRVVHRLQSLANLGQRAAKPLLADSRVVAGLAAIAQEILAFDQVHGEKAAAFVGAELVQSHQIRMAHVG